MLVASVARESGIMSPATSATANELVEYLAADYPESPDFITSACWADDLKSSGVNQEATWHFIDNAVCRLSDPTACPPPQEDNIVTALTEAHSTVYSKKAATLDRARQLRFIIHFMGDIHQPLHAATYFSSQFPDGDRGGNSWPIAGFSWTTELHALWDGGLGQWFGDIPRPLNASGVAWISNFTSRIAEAHPASSLGPEIADVNVTSWASASHDLAATVAYTAPQAPTPIPAAYIAAGEALCLKQIAIAGYRLATLLEYIFTAGPWAEL